MRVGLVISSASGDPSTITTALGVEPSMSSRKGDVFRPRTGALANFSVWRLDSSHPERLALEPHVEWLLATAARWLDASAELRDAWEAQITVGVTLHGSQGPELNLSAPMIQRMNDYRASLDIDVHSFG